MNYRRSQLKLKRTCSQDSQRRYTKVSTWNSGIRLLDSGLGTMAVAPFKCQDLNQDRQALISESAVQLSFLRNSEGNGDSTYNLPSHNQ